MKQANKEYLSPFLFVISFEFGNQKQLFHVIIKVFT